MNLSKEHKELEEEETEEQEISMFSEHKVMVQSYEILTGKTSYEDLLEKGDEVAVVFNPLSPVVSMEDDVYDLLIEYFVYLEDYEKAAELRDQKRLNSYYSLPAPPLTCSGEKTSSRLNVNR